MADKKLIVEIGAKLDKLEAGLKQAEGKVSKFGGVVKKIGGLLAGAFAVSKITAFASEVSKLAGGAEGVEAAFRRLNNPELLKELRDATRGTVSDLELMKAAVQANNFKIPMEQLGKLLAFAHQRAKDTGQSVDYLVESIVMGIGRKSPLILDNLGISAIELREKFGEVGVEAATVGDIAKAVGDIAEREMAKVGNSVVTTAERTAQLNAKWENYKIVLGDIVNKIKNELIPVAIKAVDWLAKITGTDRAMTEKAEKSYAALTDRLRGLSDAEQEAGLLRYMEITQGKLIESKNEKNIKYYEELIRLLGDAYFQGVRFNKVMTGGGETGEPKAKPGLEAPMPSNADLGLKEYWNDQTAEEIFDQGDKDDWKDFVDSMVYESEKLNVIPDKFANIKNAISELSDSLIELGVNSESMGDFAKSAGSAARQSIAAFIAESVAAQITKLMTDRNVNPWAALLMGGLVGGATAAVFNSVVPSFAQGGFVKSPTLAVVGDNPSGKGEFIIPAEKMGSGRIQIEGKVRGYDLYWASKNYEKHLNRTT